MEVYLGIDVGSTTLKLVLLNEENEILYKIYTRHFAKPKEVALEQISKIKDLLLDKKLYISITGSAGLGIAKNCGIPFVQEVFATSIGVEQNYPQTDVVIELGGEDAKILFLKGGLEERMNGTCAGGTGAFIDQMANLMNLTPNELDELSLSFTKLYPIASRCGVFAKTDVQPLLNQGVSKADISASIFQAVVEQTIGGLSQGREITGNVLFLGGPLYFLKGLRERFVKTLNLKEEEAIFPELAPYFVAYGTALYSKQANVVFDYNSLVQKLSLKSEKVLANSEPPLFANKEEYDEFVTRHKKHTIAKNDIKTYSGEAYLGIDSGSTTLKIVLIDKNDKLLYQFYSSNKGNPVDLLKDELSKVYELCQGHIHIVSSAVTGYGEDLIKAAFGIDYGIVETIAHYNGAKYFNPNVDFIIDIGGQDIKCFSIKNGEIDSIVLNEACSSGCGSFLQSFAVSMGYDLKEFSKLAIFATHPSKLGSRCTVFMNSSVKQAQKDGASVEDISAGLAISVIKNAVYKVIRARNADELGNNIVVQGGTFLNDAVLRAFEKELGKDVIRLDVSELMGAFGAAIYAKNNANKTSSLISKEELDNFTHTTKLSACNLCANKCALTINLFGDKKFIIGNKCERGAGGVIKTDLPNMIEFKNKLLKSYIKYPKEGQKVVGIPFVLNMYEMFVFWSSFFDFLDIGVVTSKMPNKQKIFKASQTIPSDTVCYPAKISHYHIADLLDKKADFIFYPCMSYGINEKISDNSYNCPVVAYYPELLNANVSGLKDTKFLYPHIVLDDLEFLSKVMQKELEKVGLKFSKKELLNAVNFAKNEFDNYKDKILQEGKRVLDFVVKNDKEAIVLACRPYHIDKNINHGIDKYLNSLGFVVLSDDSLELSKVETVSLNQWSYHARMYSAANFVSEYDKIELVQLVSFGCGIDAITGDEIKRILTQNGKIYTQLKIDEISNLGAVKIRLRSLQATMREKQRQKLQSIEALDLLSDAGNNKEQKTQIHEEKRDKEKEYVY